MTVTTKPEPLHIAIEFHGPAATHNLMCWLCDERPAVYKMHPDWVFAPCWTCQAQIASPVGTQRRPWWRFWA
jgi:hypothetical protein